ncbi:MAG: MBL fold metallo-hydrolase [Planctomycetota bacterium]
MPEPLRIVAHTGGIAQTNCFLVVDEGSKDAVLFDAPDHTVEPLLDHVDEHGLKLVGLWLTHGHYDHIADHAVVRERFPEAELLVHRDDLPMLAAPQAALFQLPFDIPPATPTGHVADGDRLHIGSIAVDVIHTPGHAPGHVCFHLPDHHVLIGGDLILMNAIGRTDLPGGDEATLMRSLRRIMQLLDETQLLPGHGTADTLGRERQVNPFVAAALRG